MQIDKKHFRRPFMPMEGRRRRTSEERLGKMKSRVQSPVVTSAGVDGDELLELDTHARPW